MAAVSRRENVISLAEVRAERRVTSPVVLLEMNWDPLPGEEEPWEMGRTIWLAVVISAALWAVIAGVLWFL
jgi:hypothetical protein